jgi:hypothetical protein
MSYRCEQEGAQCLRHCFDSLLWSVPTRINRNLPTRIFSYYVPSKIVLNPLVRKSNEFLIRVIRIGTSECLSDFQKFDVVECVGHGGIGLLSSVLMEELFEHLQA